MLGSYRFAVVLMVGVLVGLVSSAQADIIDWNCEDDGDGAIVCVAQLGDKDGDEYPMSIEGNQFWSPGHMVGWFQTDTPDDPTIRVINTIDNETGFSWTAYRLNLFMSAPFTLSAAVVYDPVDWTATITQQPIWNGTNYQGQIDYSGGTAIAPGGSLEFGYKMSFSGSTSYNFTQEMIPIPEPSAGVLLAGLGTTLAGIWLFRRRR